MFTALRPANRIPAARLAILRAKAAAKVQVQALADAQAQQEADDRLWEVIDPLAEFVGVPRLTMLPGGLHWSNQAPVPAIGATVTVIRNGHQERAEVRGYIHAAGFLGLVTETTHHAKGASRKLGASLRAGVVFGSQLALAA